MIVFYKRQGDGPYDNAAVKKWAVVFIIYCAGKWELDVSNRKKGDVALVAPITFACALVAQNTDLAVGWGSPK